MKVKVTMIDPFGSVCSEPMVFLYPDVEETFIHGISLRCNTQGPTMYETILAPGPQANSAMTFRLRFEVTEQ